MNRSLWTLISGILFATLQLPASAAEYCPAPTKNDVFFISSSLPNDKAVIVGVRNAGQIFLQRCQIAKINQCQNVGKAQRGVLGSAELKNGLEPAYDSAARVVRTPATRDLVFRAIADTIGKLDISKRPDMELANREIAIDLTDGLGAILKKPLSQRCTLLKGPVSTVAFAEAVDHALSPEALVAYSEWKNANGQKEHSVGEMNIREVPEQSHPEWNKQKQSADDSAVSDGKIPAAGHPAGSALGGNKP
ncbi:MAG: hypothetical protein ACXWP5_01490 [Bdellovibrionota bacterium]